MTATPPESPTLTHTQNWTDTLGAMATDPNANGNGKATITEVYRAVDALRADVKTDLNRLFDLMDKDKEAIAKIDRDFASLQSRLATISTIIGILVPVAGAALIRAFIP